MSISPFLLIIPSHTAHFWRWSSCPHRQWDCRCWQHQSVMHAWELDETVALIQHTHEEFIFNFSLISCANQSVW